MKEKNTYNYSKLKGRMREKDITQEDLAKAVGIGKTTLNLKMCNNVEFRQDEILGIVQTLDISPEDISQYFFTI